MGISPIKAVLYPGMIGGTLLWEVFCCIGIIVKNTVWSERISARYYLIFAQQSQTAGVYQNLQVLL